jgi:class 3 adenylate cyclase
MFSRKPLQITWEWQLNASPKQLWPLITNTNQLFKDLCQPSIQQAHLSQSVPPGFIQLSYNGLNRYEVWEEEPHEWEYPFRFGFTRHYQSGPYKTIQVQVDLQRNTDGTLATVAIDAKPRVGLFSLLSTFKMKTLMRRRLRKTVRRYDKMAMNSKMRYQQSDEKKLVHGGDQRLKQILEDLHNNEVDAVILEKIINFVRHADDLALQRIHPYKLADKWDIPRDKVLKVFIHASKADLLNFNWDLHCPTCRSIQESVKTLNQIHEPIYCEECEQEFGVNFNKTIQLTFTPHPLIRKVDNKTYSIRGPQTKPHVVMQQYLEAGQNCFIKTELPAGTYILRSSRSAGTATIHVRRSGDKTIHIELNNAGLQGEEATITNDPNLSIQNSSKKAQVVTLEQVNWANDTVSAAQVTSSQLFRDLFANEVLKKGEKISVDNLTLMFTDLFDSTGMYNEEGDDKAVGQVINHFEVLEDAIANENGAVVKTIGDSVMAVFCEPEHALRAYLRAQKILSQDKRFSKDLQLKAGIHHGSCVAANLNSRIDYFGSTVNIASRFVDYASENEAIISQGTLTESNLQTILSEYSNGISVKNKSTRLKGFQKESFLIKRIKVDGGSPLRLAI